MLTELGIEPSGRNVVALTVSTRLEVAGARVLGGHVNPDRLADAELEVTDTRELGGDLARLVTGDQLGAGAGDVEALFEGGGEALKISLRSVRCDEIFNFFLEAFAEVRDQLDVLAYSLLDKLGLQRRGVEADAEVELVSERAVDAAGRGLDEARGERRGETKPAAQPGLEVATRRR
jgi:hypothetical protein